MHINLLAEKSFELGGDPAKGPFFKGLAFKFSNGAHGSIANSLAISFASRAVQEATRRPRQLEDSLL